MNGNKRNGKGKKKEKNVNKMISVGNFI